MTKGTARVSTREQPHDQGIRLLAADEQVQDDPTGRFMETISAAMAQLDRDIRSDRASKRAEARRLAR